MDGFYSFDSSIHLLITPLSDDINPLFLSRCWTPRLLNSFPPLYSLFSPPFLPELILDRINPRDHALSYYPAHLSFFNFLTLVWRS